jgi:serine/threonine protein kinase
MLIRELVALERELTGSEGELHGASGDREPRADTGDAIDSAPDHFLRSGLAELAGDEASPPRSSRYTIDRPIGKGGIGQVWRVFDVQNQRPLALKTLLGKYRLRTEVLDRFLSEGRLTGTLQHPGIPPIYDHGHLDDGTPFFAMKLVEGETLQTILNRRESSAEDLGAALAIFISVAQTLAYAHSQHVVHRDVKPHNIMVGRFGEVQVMDWGLAKRLGSPDDPETSAEHPGGEGNTVAPKRSTPIEPGMGDTPQATELTTAGDIVGTPGYMAPEQARGEVDAIDPRADVFGLGAILFQILTFRPLFEGLSQWEIVERTRRGTFDGAIAALDRIGDHAELVQLCRDCLATYPSDRPDNAGEVVRRARAFVAEMEHRMHQAEIEASRSEVQMVESRKRQRWILGLTTALTTTSLIAAILIGVQWRRATEAARVASIQQARAEQENATTAEINAFLNQVLSSSLPERLGPDVTLREVIDDALPELDGKFTRKPAVEAAIRSTLGESLRWLGDPDSSEQQLRRAVAAYQQARPGDSPEVLETKDRLAGVLRSRAAEGDLKESEQLRRDVLAGMKQQFGGRHPRVAEALNDLGVVLLEQQRVDEAAALFRQALELLESLPDHDPADLIVLRTNLADIARNRGDWATAEQLYTRVIEDPDVNAMELGNALVQFGEMLHRHERVDEAIERLRQALEVREDFFGPLNPLTLSAMRKLARVYDSGRRYREQLALLDESLRRHLEVFRPAAGAVLEGRRLRANALIGLERDREAEAYLRESVELASEQRGADHEYTRLAIEQLKAYQARRAGQTLPEQ